MFKFSPKVKESLRAMAPELDTREGAIDQKLRRAVAHQIGMNMARRGQRNPSPDAELIEEVAPSSRHLRRLRRRNSAAFAKKSRRTAFRRRNAAIQVEQNFRGQARIYFGVLEANPAVTANVVGAVRDLAEKLATRDGISAEKALERVEKRMHALLEDYGDIDEEAAA